MIRARNMSGALTALRRWCSDSVAVLSTALRSPATGLSRDSRIAADAYRQGLVTARIIVGRRALELEADGYPESKMGANVLANVSNEINAIVFAAGPTRPPMMEVEHIVRKVQDEKRVAIHGETVTITLSIDEYAWLQWQLRRTA